MAKLKDGVQVSPGLICRLLNEKDLPQVNELIASHYSFQNPGRQMFRVTKEDLGDFDVRMAKENIKSNASLGTFVKETGELIHVEMNTIHDVTEGNTHFNQHVSERLAASRRYVKNLIGDVFSDLNTNRYLHGSMACIRSDYRSRGIFAAIEELRVILAKARGCEYVVSGTESRYAQMAAKSYGYTVLREVPYADYIDPKTGLKPDLKLSPIHTKGQLVYKRIRQASELKYSLPSKL